MCVFHLTIPEAVNEDIWIGLTNPSLIALTSDALAEQHLRWLNGDQYQVSSFDGIYTMGGGNWSVMMTKEGNLLEEDMDAQIAFLCQYDLSLIHI